MTESLQHNLQEEPTRLTSQNLSFVFDEIESILSSICTSQQNQSQSKQQWSRLIMSCAQLADSCTNKKKCALALGEIIVNVRSN